MVGIQSAELITLDGVAGTGWEESGHFHNVHSRLNLTSLALGITACYLTHL